MSIDWLSNLEEKVKAASARLGELGEENGALRAKIAELERELASGVRQASDGEAGWKREREEIRKRVERLVAGLEQTLGE